MQPPHRLLTPPQNLLTPPHYLLTPPQNLLTPPHYLLTPPHYLFTTSSWAEFHVMSTKNAAKGRKEVTIQIDSSVRLHDDSKRWNFRRGEEDNEDEESDEESDESCSPVAVMAD